MLKVKRLWRDGVVMTMCLMFLMVAGDASLIVPINL